MHAQWYARLKERGFFRYVGRSVLLIAGSYALLVLIVFMIGRHLVDFNALFGSLLQRTPDRLVLVLFFVSESLTGMIPVDLFVIWTQKFEQSMLLLALMGLLSYAGGIISYGIGAWILKPPRIRAYTEKRLQTYIGFVRRWGGAFIIIAALFPFTPFSLVVIALSLLHYPFRPFLLFALSRLLRFILQGAFFFELLKLDQWII
jgi:membrane protein YqaA with SNARE-associated domain